MKLTKLCTHPDSEYYISTWSLLHEGQEVKQIIVQYPLVENGSVPFTTFLRRKAVSAAREMGFIVSAEDIMIDPLNEPVDLVQMVRKIFNMDSLIINN